MEVKMKLTKDKKLVLAYIRANECHICTKTMIVKEKISWYDKTIFPVYYGNSQDAQMIGTGIVYQSDIKVDDKYICIECAEQGKATFLCALCEERKTTDKEKRSFGDPAEYLCTDCYEKTPAKQWDEMIKYLENEHRYDYE